MCKVRFGPSGNSESFYEQGYKNTEQAAEWLSKMGLSAFEYSFGRGTKISESIREIILDGKNTAMTDECEALLYAAARVQHLADTVKPALDRGEIVLCDRYIFSSFAYQGYGRGLDMTFLKEINRYAMEKFMPDLTLFLDLPAVNAFARKHGADKNDRIEQAGEAFHNRVYNGYKSLLNEYRENILPVDCSGTKFETNEKIIQILRSRGLIS